MQVNIIMQKEDENTIANAISNYLEEEAKKAYFFVGNFKETGYKIIEEDLIDRKTKLFFVIGIDKKNTTKAMLEGLLNYKAEVYYYSNNDLKEFVSNICIFEYKDKADVLISSGNMSESGLKTDLVLYTNITYDLTNEVDKKEYKEQVKELVKLKDNEGFEKLEKATVKKLLEGKEIFSTRQYNHDVMSISELLNKKEQLQNNNEKKVDEPKPKEVKKQIEIPKIDLSDIAIDIDISADDEEIDIKPVKKDELSIDYVEDETVLPDDIEKYDEVEEIQNVDEIDKNNELYDENLEDTDLDLADTIDINDMLFSKADIKLDITQEKSKKPKKTSKKEQEDDIVKVKKVNLNNVTNLIFELSSKNSKDPTCIRIPNYIRTMIPAFFGMDEAKSEDIKGVLYKVKDISLEIVDVKNNIKINDTEAKIKYKPKQSYISFESKKFEEIMYDENDIARIIKLDENTYHIELVAKKVQEYKVWSKLCNQTFRASEKKFGMM